MSRNLLNFSSAAVVLIFSVLAVVAASCAQPQEAAMPGEEEIGSGTSVPPHHWEDVYSLPNPWRGW